MGSEVSEVRKPAGGPVFVEGCGGDSNPQINHEAESFESQDSGQVKEVGRLILDGLAKVSNREFLEVLFQKLPDSAAVALASKHDVSSPGWQVSPWRPGQEYAVRRGMNAYYCVAAHLLADPFRRIKQNSQGLYVLVLDDIGTKVDRALIRLKATYALETSKGNFQIGYRLTEPITEIDLVDRLGRAVMRAGLSDAGANGFSARLVRLPQGWNSKRDPLWECRLVTWRPELAYSLDDLVMGLGLELDPPKPERKPCPIIMATKSTPYGTAALTSMCVELAAMPENSGRNACLNEFAFAVGQLVAGGELEETEALTALELAAHASGLDDQEIEKTIRSGFDAGMQEPRSAPNPDADHPSDWGREDGQRAGQSTSTSQDSCIVCPRVPYPWEVLPDPITSSLKQLGRSCATSPTALPLYAICMVSAAVGRFYEVSPKSSWQEPLIFWGADIRHSGQGKTAQMQALAKAFKDRQAAEHERYLAEIQTWEATPPKERRGQQPPRKVRGYFVTALTLEGVHADLDQHPTGGLVVLMNELSAWLNGQGEYKGGRGSDRESWLCLHDGGAARIARAGGSVMLRGARPQICGGIQPGIFARQFSSQNGTYLEDGTIYRMLVSYEGQSVYPLTAESWSEDSSKIWRKTMDAAMEWADEQTETTRATLDAGAQQRFLNWANDLRGQMDDMPSAFRGFIPKAIGYALRLTGAIHLLHCFSAGEKPRSILTSQDVERGIRVAEYHLGQAMDALQLVTAQGAVRTPAEVSDRSAALALTLGQLRDQTDDGKLAVGRIREEYDAMVLPADRLGSDRAMGALLRSCGLPPRAGKHDFRDKRRVSCLIWDDSVDSFIQKQCLHVSMSPNEGGPGASEGDVDKPDVSNVSMSPERDWDDGDMETSPKTMSPSETHVWQGMGDMETWRRTSDAYIGDAEVDI